MERRGKGASVIVIRGRGEDRLRQAVQQGLIAQDLRADVDEVLGDVRRARLDCDVAMKLLDNERNSYKRFEKVYYEALQAKHREDVRRQRFMYAKTAVIIFLSMFVIVLLCMMICRVIFG